MSRITTEDEARKLARVMASDIQIYNAEKIRRGLENDNLFEELTEDLRDAERNWRERVDPSVGENSNFFQHAFVDMIFGGSRSVKSRIF